MVIINYDEKFRREVMQAIEDGITKLWGKDVAQVIFYNFSRDAKLGKDEIVLKPELFQATLEKMFGELGSKSVTSTIVKEINRHFQLSKNEFPQTSSIEHAIRLAWKARERA